MFRKKRDVVYVQIVPPKKSWAKPVIEFVLGAILAGMVIWIFILATSH